MTYADWVPPADELPLIYVAGPYTAPTPEGISENVRRAQLWGSAINATGLAWAVVPHNFSQGMQASLSEQQWLAFTLASSRRFDGVLLMPGFIKSTGSMGEMCQAEYDGRPWVASLSLANVEVSVRELVHAISNKRALVSSALKAAGAGI